MYEVGEGFGRMVAFLVECLKGGQLLLRALWTGREMSRRGRVRERTSRPVWGDQLLMGRSKKCLVFFDVLSWVPRFDGCCAVLDLRAHVADAFPGEYYIGTSLTV